VDGEALVTMRTKYPYITKLNNLYDLGSDPLEIRKEANRASMETEPNEWVEVNSGEYKSALRANPHSTSLMDPEEVTPGYRCFRLDKEGESTNIYYSISPEGEICGLVNNGPHKGLAVPSSLNHALAHGGSWLNCWDVNSKLPDLYVRYGFRVTNIEPYDQETYGEPSEDLKASWRLSGWKEGEPYPGVVYMTHQGSKLGSLTKRELPGDSEFSPRSIIVQAKSASVSDLTEYDCDLIRDWFYGVFMLLAAPPNLKKALKKFDLNYPEMVLHRTCWLKEQDIEKVVGAMAEGTSVRVRTSRPDTHFQSWSGSLEKARRFGKGIGSQGSPPAGWDRFLVSAHIPGSSILAGAEDMKEHLDSAITRLSLTPHLEEALQDLYRTLDYYTGRQHDQDEYIIHLVDAPVFSAEPIAPDPKIMRQDLSRNAKKVKAKEGKLTSTIPVFQLRTPSEKGRPYSKSVIGIHYSATEGLSHLSTKMYGKGSAGAERRRIQSDPELKYRTFFYESPDGQAVEGEALVTKRAQYLYVTRLKNLYDLGEDPLKLRVEANDASHLEKLIIGEGFDGYISPSGIPGMPEARPLVIIGDCEIPVKALSHEKVSTQISDALPKRSSQELRLTDEDCEVLHKWVNGYFMSGPSTKMNERLEKVFEKLPFQYTSKRLHRALWVDKDTLLKLQQARKEGVGVNLCTSAKAGQQFQSWSGSIMASLRFSQQVGKEGRGKYWVVVTAQIPGDKVKLRTKDLNSYIQGLKDPSSGESLLSQALYQYTSEDEYIVQLGSESLEIETYMWASKKTPPKQASSDDSFGLYEDEYWIEPSGQLHKAEFGHEAFASDYLKDEILLDHPTYTLFDRGWARCEIGELSAELEGRKLNQAQFNQFQILVNQSVTPEYRENFKVWIEEGTWYVQWDVSDFLKLKNINAVMRGRTKIEQRE
jgi:hypothetical protein